MAEFVSSFITGFQDVVRDDLSKRFPKIKILNVFDGLIHFRYDGNSRELENIKYFNNTFYVLKSWNNKNISFKQMINEVDGKKSTFIISKGTFRVRFSQENQFAKVDKQLVRKAEEMVINNSRLQVDRLSPSTEIWYSIRREGFAFCGQLISKREFTEKNLNKGELRPEIAYFICCFADLNQNDVVLEPFCGYGSIPVQLSKKIRFNKLFASDIDQNKIEMVRNKKQLSNNENICVSVQDAFELKNIPDNFVDVIISDPPWGFYEDIGDIKEFYIRMLNSFERVLKKGGKLVILTARKEEFESSIADFDYVLTNSLHTLVNGKKASLYSFIKND